MDETKIKLMTNLIKSRVYTTDQPSMLTVDYCVNSHPQTLDTMLPSTKFGEQKLVFHVVLVE